LLRSIEQDESRKKLDDQDLIPKSEIPLKINPPNALKVFGGFFINQKAKLNFGCKKGLLSLIYRTLGFIQEIQSGSTN
jgi:hypothetical protein